MTCFMVTDISNVARFLSLGCLGPRTIHDEKYRPDASVRHGGALVLFEDVRLAAQEAARSEGAVVIVEIRSDYLASIPAQDGLQLTGSLIPVSSIARLHFRDEATLREFRTLEYQNVDPMVLEQVVDASVFEVADEDVADPPKGKGTSQATLEIEEAASAPPLALISAEKVEDIDRSVGALAAILRPLRPTKSLLQKAGDVAGAVIQATKALDATVGEILVSKEDMPLHAAVCTAMRATSHDDIGHDDILDVLSGQSPHLLEQFTVIREMLAASRDVVPEEFSSPCLRAALLALIGRSPAALRSFPLERLPDDIEAEILSLWYAGLREGGARRPVEDRLGDFEATLQNWAARQGAAGAPPTYPRTAFKPKVRATVGVGRFEYFLEDKSLSIGPIPREFPSLLERLKALARGSSRAAVSMAVALDVSIVTTIVFSKDAAFTVSDSRLTVEVPHRLERATDSERVCLALEGAGEDILRELAARHLVPPVDAP